MSQDPEQVALARRLRGEGRLLPDIAEELDVCVATASVWTRGVLPYGTPTEDRAGGLLQARPLQLSQLRHDRWKVECPPHLAVPTFSRMEVRSVESFNAMQGLS